MAENLHQWQQLCSGSSVEFIRKSAAHTIVATNANFKAKEPFWYTFQFFTKNCTKMAPWLRNQIFEGSHCGTHIWEGGSHCGTQKPSCYSLFLEEVLTLRSIFGTLRGNWWHFLVLYSSPVYPLSVWCFGEVETSFFSRHYGNVKLLGYDSCLKWGP